MKTTINTNSITQSSPRVIKNFYNSGFDFQIPKNIPDNGFLGDLGSTDFNDIIEFTSPTREIYPGIYSGDKWKEVDCEQDTFSLCITSYADDLYELTVLDGNRDQEIYPADTYSPEMFQFLYSIEEKRGIEFPLTSQYNKQSFRANSIILDKKQLFELLQDMKIESTELFESGEYSQAIPTDEIKNTGDNSYEIINVLPTDFYDNGTFSSKKFLLTKPNNAEIYITGLSQTLSNNILSTLNLNQFIDEIEFIIMPDDYVQIQLKYTKNISDKIENVNSPGLMSEIAEIIGGYKYSEFFYSRFKDISEFIQKNLKKQIELSEKRKISLPLSKGLGLEKDTDTKILLPLEQLNDFLKDFQIAISSVVPPTKKADKKLKPLVCEGYSKELLENIFKIKSLSLNPNVKAGIIDGILEDAKDNETQYRIEKEKLFIKRKFYLFNKKAEKQEANIRGIYDTPESQEAFQKLADITQTDINEIKRVWGTYYGKGDFYDMIGNGFGSLISAVKLMLQKKATYSNKFNIRIGFTQDQMEFLENIFKDIIQERNYDIYLLLDEMFDINTY